jgi:rare lipoprotein A
MAISPKFQRALTLKAKSRPAFVLAVLMASSAIASDTAIPASALPTPPTVHGVLPNEVAAPDIAKVTAFTRIKSGMASWYGKVLQNHLTASGRRFNMFELTAAHRDLPFGSRVRVTDLRNHRSVVVTITDRGVLDPDRVIDLSYGAAKQLQMIKSGVDPVTLDVLAIKGVPAVPRKPDDLDLDPTLATLQYPVDHR